MRKITVLMLAATLTWAVLGRQAWAQKNGKEQAELANALKGAKVSLEQALQASEREGQPISAKFEVEDGKLQLSAYTMKAGKFAEVIVDHQNGKISKVEAITEGEDLTSAKAQAQAMSKAKFSLRAAVQKTVTANSGFRAVSVSPDAKSGQPLADITLVKGQEFKSVSEKLN